MNKQELIEKLTRNRDKCFEEAKKYAGLSWDPQILDAKALVYMQVINWVEQLDEQPKVTVPKFVADWIKQCKEKATLADCLNGYYQISNGQVIESEDFQNWVVDNENDELTAKAWMFGYEVESVLWIVKLGKTYFRDFDNYCGDLIAIPDDGLDAKKHAFKFDDKSKALKVADEIGGIVEEVK